LRILLALLGAAGALEVALALWLPSSRAQLVLLFGGALTLALLREAAVAERRFRSTDAPQPPPPSPPSAEDLIAAKAQEEETRGFSCIAFEMPPLRCPRSELAEVLARHEAIVRARLQGLTFLARMQPVWKDPFDRMYRYALAIEARGSSVSAPIIGDCFEIARRFAAFRSIAHRLAEFRGHERMYVVVADDDAVSVRELDLLVLEGAGRSVRRQLVLVRDDAIFEPVRQSLEQDGQAWIRRHRATASSPRHEERLVVGPPASSKEECLDRLLAACEERLRECIDYAQEMGRLLAEAIFWCGPGNRFGPHAHALVYERRDWPEDLFEHWPQCDLALREPWPPGWAPVFVTRGALAGIRWISVASEPSEHPRPASVTEWKAGGTRRVRSALDPDDTSRCPCGTRLWCEASSPRC
jgi:hypothetical protein